MDKLDYKKEYKDLYIPKNIPSIVNVPNIGFVLVDGKGKPGSYEFQNAISLLYSITFSIKMSKMNNTQPEGYFEYVVPPLEATWYTTGNDFDFFDNKNWKWTMMIRQPEFVDEKIFEKYKLILEKKKAELDINKLRFEYLYEGLCMQIMHIGTYDSEYISIDKLNNNIQKEGYIISGKHHEIYLSDPRKTKPENLKTVIRYPIIKK